MVSPNSREKNNNTASVQVQTSADECLSLKSLVEDSEVKQLISLMNNAKEKGEEDGSVAQAYVQNLPEYAKPASVHLLARWFNAIFTNSIVNEVLISSSYNITAYALAYGWRSWRGPVPLPIAYKLIDCALRGVAKAIWRGWISLEIAADFVALLTECLLVSYARVRQKWF